MKTLYIDVYFLINFTVDILALYFAASFSKIHTTVPRLIIAALVGAMYAVFGILFMKISKIMYLLSVVFLIVMVLTVTGRVSTYRRIKYAAAFILFEILIGGLVYYAYGLLDKFMESVSLESVGGENKNLLILSLIVLLSIGVLKVVISFFGNSRSEKNIRLTVRYKERERTLDALVDSGNLAVDPLDKTPVMLVTYKEALEIFGGDADVEAAISSADYSLKKRTRVIPVTFGENARILYAIKVDAVYAAARCGKEKISVIIAIDKEGEDYGGYSALVPLSAVEDVFYGNR